MARKRVVRRNPVNRRRTPRLMAHRRNAPQYRLYGGDGKWSEKKVLEALFDSNFPKRTKKRNIAGLLFTGKKWDKRNKTAAFEFGKSFAKELIKRCPSCFNSITAKGKTFNAWVADIKKSSAFQDAADALTRFIKTNIEGGELGHWGKGTPDGQLRKEIAYTNNGPMSIGFKFPLQKVFIEHGGAWSGKKASPSKKKEMSAFESSDLFGGSTSKKKKKDKKKKKGKKEEVGCLDEDRWNELKEKIDDLHSLKEKMEGEIKKTNPALRRAGSSRYTRGFQYTPWMKLPVPARMTRTPRSAAEGVYVLPKLEKFPIGDLYHARKAVNYVFGFPSNRKYTRQVVRAVQRDYPDYAWGRYWRSKIQAYQAKMKKEQKRANKILAWGELSKPPKSRKRRRAVANPWMLI